MNVLISGSSGLIGSALTSTLTASGHRVVRLVRSGGTPAPSSVRDVSWDPDGNTIDQAALTASGPFDAVVHLAGAGIGDHRWNATRRRQILDSRTRSTSLLVEAIVRCDPLPGVLVSASAIGFYGDRGDEELTEESPSGSGFLAEVCRAWEAAAAPAAAAGVRTVLLRTGIVLAPSGGALAKQLPLFRLGVGGKIGPGSQYRSWITLEDEVRAILHCLTIESLSGPVNATAPHPVTERQMASALGAALHRPAVLPVPAFALKAVLGAEMAQEIVLSSQRVLPTRLLDTGFTFSHPDVEAALTSVLARS